MHLCVIPFIVQVVASYYFALLCLLSLVQKALSTFMCTVIVSKAPLIHILILVLIAIVSEVQ